jgi:hypothetical protein
VDWILLVQERDYWGGLLWTQYEHFGSIKCWELVLAEQLLVSPPCSWFVTVYQHLSATKQMHTRFLPKQNVPGKYSRMPCDIWISLYCRPFTVHDGSGGKPSDLYSGATRNTTILRLSVIFLSSSRRIPGLYIQIGHDRSHPYRFQFIIQWPSHHSIWATQSVIEYTTNKQTIQADRLQRAFHYSADHEAHRHNYNLDITGWNIGLRTGYWDFS